MGLEKLVGRVREKLEEHRIRRELAELERVYLEDVQVDDKHARKSSTSSGTKRAKKRTGRREKPGWDSLDGYFE